MPKRSSKIDPEVLDAIFKARQGDEDSVAFLMEYVEPKIREIVSTNKRYWVNGYSYDDIQSECYILLLRAIDTFNPEINPNFKHYCGLMFNGRVISLIKESQRGKSLALNSSVSIDAIQTNHVNGEEFKLEDMMRDDRKMFSEVIEKRDYCENLKEKLYRHLTKKESDVFDLFLEHYSYEEIAQMLSIKNKSVDNAIQRVKKKKDIFLSEEIREFNEQKSKKKKALKLKDKNRQKGAQLNCAKANSTSKSKKNSKES